MTEDNIRGIPCWDFKLLSIEQLEGLWKFIDLFPDHVQGYLEEAHDNVISKKMNVPNVRPPENVDVAEKNIMGLRGRGFRD